MGEAQRGRLVPGDKGGALRAGLAVAALAVAAAGLLAGCQGAGGSTSPGGTVTASAARATASAPAAGPAPASTGPAAGGGTFAPIIERFDPGHPARAKAPAACGSQDSTLAIEQCYEGKTETADASIDTLRQSAFARASAAQQAVINAADRAWLNARDTICGAASHTGGTIDAIGSAACLLDESTARLHALRGDKVPAALLKATDSTNPGDLAWYTTPAGSRITMRDTQGDATGGVIVAWTIVAGAEGFTVNPADFGYRDGSFTDPGTVQGADPRGHHVATATEYQFTVDYGHLPADPGKAGGWVYAPGSPAATWR